MGVSSARDVTQRVQRRPTTFTVCGQALRECVGVISLHDAERSEHRRRWRSRTTEAEATIGALVVVKGSAYFLMGMRGPALSATMRVMCDVLLVRPRFWMGRRV
jgi:hypothetical protein